MTPQLGFPWNSLRKARRANARVRPWLAPRMATAVLRVPDPRVITLPLPLLTPGGPQIFVHEGARQALERRLTTAFAGPVQLAVTDNRRRMVTHSKARGTLRVRVHMMFLGAPDRVRDALVAYVVHGDEKASQVIGSYIDQNLHRIRASRPVPGPLKTRGEVHDLLAILGDLNHEYFGGTLSDVLVTWGRMGAGSKNSSRKTIKLGSSSFKVKSGKKGKITVKLTRKGLKALKRLKRLKVTVTVTVKRGNNTATKKVKVTLKAPKKRH